MSNPRATVDIVARDQTGRAFKSVAGNMTALKGQAVALGSSFGLMSSLGVSALVGMARSAIDFGSAITDAGAATRTSLEPLQALRALAKDVGADYAKLDMALIRAQKSGQDAANGLSTMTRAFDTLNINVETFNRLSPDRMLEAIAKAMAASQDPAAAYAAAMDILGTRNAPKLMEALQVLAGEGVDQLTDRMKDAGRVMKEETAVAMDEAADAIGRFKDRGIIFLGEFLAKAETFVSDVKTEFSKLGDVEKVLTFLNNPSFSALRLFTQNAVREGVEQRDRDPGNSTINLIGDQFRKLAEDQAALRRAAGPPEPAPMAPTEEPPPITMSGQYTTMIRPEEPEEVETKSVSITSMADLVNRAQDAQFRAAQKRDEERNRHLREINDNLKRQQSIWM